MSYVDFIALIRRIGRRTIRAILALDTPTWLSRVRLILLAMVGVFLFLYAFGKAQFVWALWAAVSFVLSLLVEGEC